ncbi:DUF2785 domain-containing protein [Thermomonas brevis]|uniref:DUF2785 domain-containing protein n=1 Tax=Thermomonas brevis TaxID=215691 RepID=A0A7G9QWC0_9GAMM|nr:DUF2785 domain-containing protein [Thermomonas brevis]QNN47645.1 DUF2785 domain-containing protein [Thermomonas brevis]
MSFRIRALFLLLAMLATLPAHARCALSTDAHDSLKRWKAAGFDVADAVGRNARALALVDCLGDADPFLRDGIAFEALSSWMRGGLLDDASLLAIEPRLLAQLDGEDGDGFRKPFAALVLSEVARTDRIRPWMTQEQRTRLVDAAAAYLRSVRDYRGYVDGEGWRHGVAHGADWAMQLALNEALQPAQVSALLDAVGSQSMPADDRAYAFGEPARLARAAVYLIARGDLEQTAVAAWLNRLVSTLGTRPETDPQAAWWTRRANLENFLNALGSATAVSANPALSALAGDIRKTLAALP